MTQDIFSNQMWLTYKARFNAHARLLLQNTLYSIITAVLSVFIIIVNILQLVPDLLSINQLATTCYTISVSIIILIISIVFVSSNKKKQAEKFHACALEIQRIYREYTTRKNEPTENEMKEYTSRYDDVLSKYDINHSKTDYLKVKMITREGYGFYNILSYYFFNIFINYFILLLLLVVPIIIGILILRW
jgi:hypothetical protein